MTMKLRAHQQALVDRAASIASGDVTHRETVVYVTPGGGKTRGAIEFANRLRQYDIIDHVLFVVPTDALRSQVEESVAEARKGWLLRVASNESLPFVRDGARGYITTYASVDKAPALHEHAISRGRWLVVLDEFHHVSDAEHASWRGAIERIVRMSAHTLFMTGTPERHDGMKLPFIDRCYVSDGVREYMRPDVEYKLADALAEDAVIRAEFHYLDGEVSWRELSTDLCIGGSLSTMTDMEQSRALFTFLDKCSEEAIERCAMDWDRHRRNHPSAQMLVIARDQTHAKNLVKSASRLGFTASLAVSDEGESKSRLARFRSGRGPLLLVTVQMASEGFDAPGISHLCLLTKYRSQPWLAQAVARATRVDRKAGDPRSQAARVFCPDDPQMREFVSRWTEDQQAGIAQREERESTSESSGGGSPSVPGFAPENGQIVGERLDNLSASDSRVVLTFQSKGITLQSKETGRDLTPHEMMQAIREAMGLAEPIRPAPETEPVTLSHREKSLRDECNRLVGRLARQSGQEQRDVNRELMRRFGKSRLEMGCDELERVAKYLRKTLDMEAV